MGFYIHDCSLYRVSLSLTWFIGVHWTCVGVPCDSEVRTPDQVFLKEVVDVNVI
jgi:hypothetical protein